MDNNTPPKPPGKTGNMIWRIVMMMPLAAFLYIVLWILLAPLVEFNAEFTQSGSAPVANASIEKNNRETIYVVAQKENQQIGITHVPVNQTQLVLTTGKNELVKKERDYRNPILSILMPKPDPLYELHIEPNKLN